MKRNAKTWIAMIFTIIVAIIIFFKVDIHQIVEVIQKIQMKTLLIGIMIYIIQMYIRTIRVSQITNISQNKTSLFFYMTFYQFLLRIMPFKSGEISYVLMLNKNYKINTQTATSSLFFLRAMDALIIILIILFNNAWKVSPLLSVLLLFLSLFFIPVIFLKLYKPHSYKINIMNKMMSYISSIPNLNFKKILIDYLLTFIIYINSTFAA